MGNQKLSKRPTYNLSKVLKETGIKADTLRAWERRYQLPAPSRTEGGHRLFSDYDIETIKWLISCQDEGMRISQAVDYWRELIAAGIDPLTRPDRQVSVEPASTAVEGPRQSLEDLTRIWIDESLAFQDERAVQALDLAFAHFPWEIVCTKLIFQGLREIGERWYSGEITVQQEHFASELVVRKLSSLIASAPPPYHPQKVLISSPPGEYHSIAPLIIHTLLRYRGWDVTYLGSNVPNEHFEDALGVIHPALVIMTAARLSTSAALLETNQLLLDRSIPLAFGGKAFIDIQGLDGIIPGTFLGADLSQAVSRIETLLSRPESARESESPLNPYLDLKNEFQEKLPLLENQIMLAFTSGTTGDYSLNILHETNSFLLQDVQAALSLGDIKYLKSNLEWAIGLIDARGHDPGDVKGYLNTFLKVFQGELSDKAQPLLSWMRSYLDRLE